MARIVHQQVSEHGLALIVCFLSTFKHGAVVVMERLVLTMAVMVAVAVVIRMVMLL